MSVAEFFRYLIDHEPSQQLGVELVELYVHRIEVARRSLAAAR